MNEFTRQQTGSPSRDKFKRKHKDLSRAFFACDIDFVFVQKTPMPDIVAAIDYKQSGDDVTFSESIAYNALVRRGIPVFIVIGNVDTGAFEIKEYIGGHHRIPVARYGSTVYVNSWDEFASWERQLRIDYEIRFGP